MKRVSDSASDFVRVFAELAERLAARDIVVGRLQCDWAIFGSWVLHATNGAQEQRRSDAIRRGEYSGAGPDVFRVTWDGQDRMLSIDSSPSMVLSAVNK